MAPLLLALVGCAGTQQVAREPISLHILSFNDFHGRLLPDAKGRGGAAQMAQVIRTRMGPDSLLVSPGDLVGASPLISGHFHDEPTIEIMNALGLHVFAIGNHEFDEGIDELLRLHRGGPHPSGEATDAQFAGSRFRYLAANSVWEDGRTLFEPYEVRDVKGIPVGFIGLTLEGTAEMVAPSLDGLHFEDEVETTERYVAELQAQGVEAVVLLLHEGGHHDGGPNDCRSLSGPVVDIVKRLPKAVDLVLSAHTHQAYVCRVDGLPVVSGGAYGRFVTEAHVELSPRTRDVVSVQVQNLPVYAEQPRDPQIASIVQRYQTRIARIAERKVGDVVTDIPREPFDTGESLLGSIIADAQREATEADLAFMNLGGIRDDLVRGPATYGQLFRIQPFDNQMVTLQFSGSELIDILQGQWTVEGEFGLFQISNTLQYCWDPAKPNGQKIDESSVRVRGEALDPERTYVVAVNSYLARKSPFNRGRHPTIHLKDVEAFERWVQAQSPLQPPEPGRICVKQG